MAVPKGAASVEQYPRILTAMQLLEELSDDDSVWCGPSSEPDDVDFVDLYACFPPRHSPGLTARTRVNSKQEERSTHRRGRLESETPLDILPPGNRQAAPAAWLGGKEQKFICVINLGIQDDDRFCFVKRLLGKGGGNMRQIAGDCNAKVRLRGLGSGFLEGRQQKEANMPLNLCVSCTTYEDYVQAVRRVRGVVKELYKHYRRFIRSQGAEPPELPFIVEEVRRDDHGLDVLASKAARTDEERASDRMARRQEYQRTSSTQGAQPESQTSDAWAKYATSNGKALPGDFKRTMPSHIGDAHATLHKSDTTIDAQQVDNGNDDFSIYATPAGRRAARGVGGSLLAAKAAAAARQHSLERRVAVKSKRKVQSGDNQGQPFSAHEQGADASSTPQALVGVGRLSQTPEPRRRSKPKGKGKGSPLEAAYTLTGAADVA